jgi:hypothetical protein
MTADATPAAESAPSKRRLVAMPLSELVSAERNPQGHDIAGLSRVIGKFGFVSTPIVDERTGRLVAGHGRAESLRKQKDQHPDSPPEGIDLRPDGEWLVPVLRGWSSRSDEEAEAYLLADNRLTEKGGQDEHLLAEMLADAADSQLLEFTGYDPEDLDELEKALTGAGDGDGTAEKSAANTGILAERFGVPPFTVLDTRSGYWRTRKKAWLSLGIRSEEGRGDGGLVYGGVHKQDPQFYAKKRAVEARLGHEITTQEFLADHYAPESADGGRQQEAARKGKSGGVLFASMHRRDPDYYRKKEAVEERLGRKLTHDEFQNDHYEGMPGQAIASGTSIFDPVLCELAYRWYCPPGGTVIDPFAGGSVRGIVCAALGRAYYGGELRGEQVDANAAQWRQISAAGYLPEGVPSPTWAQGDSRTLPDNFTERPPAADLLFTCPPYADLEVYSDDPADLSNKPYPEFLQGYKACLEQGVELLADDSFAVIVVGEVREKKGHSAYYGFVPDTIRIMRELGCDYYSEHVLVNMVGSAAMAANKQFTATRKAVRVHQTVLVFVKGNAKRAADRGGIDTAIDLPDPEDAASDEEDLDDAAS